MQDLEEASCYLVHVQEVKFILGVFDHGVHGLLIVIRNTLGFKPIPECATLDSHVSNQGRICDFIY